MSKWKFLQVANMSEPVTKDVVTTTAATAEVNDISEDTDVRNFAA